MVKSLQLHQNIATESLDLATSDDRLFRERATEIAATIPRSTRAKFTQLQQATASPAIIDTIYDELLPRLRRIHTSSSKKTLRTTLSQTYELTSDESTMVAEALRDKRIHTIFSQYFSEAFAHLKTSDRKTAAKLTNELFADKVIPEMTEMIQQYKALIGYDATARRVHISYLDPQLSKRAQRKARKQIKLEERTYGVSLKEHRENTAYRLTQLSALYDGLLEEITALHLDPYELLTAANNLQKSTIKRQDKLGRLISLSLPLMQKTRKSSLVDSADHMAKIAKIIVRVGERSDVQRDLLPERLEEYRTLALDYSRIRSKKHPSTNIEKMLVI